MSVPGSIPVFVTARRAVLSETHQKALFGEAPLTPVLPLSQPGEVACAEVVTVRGPGGTLEAVRVVRRPGAQTRVELGRSDFGALGLDVPSSRAVDGSPGCTLSGPHGTVVLGEGLVGPHRHIIVDPRARARLGLEGATTCQVRLRGDRVRVLDHVPVEEWPEARAELRIDIDDANAAEVSAQTRAEVIGPDD